MCRSSNIKKIGNTAPAIPTCRLKDNHSVELASVLTLKLSDQSLNIILLFKMSTHNSRFIILCVGLPPHHPLFLGLFVARGFITQLF